MCIRDRISPEGCASILWKDQSKVETAAEQLKLTAGDLHRLGICDEIVREPTGGAHRDPSAAALALGEALERNLSQLLRLSPETLLEERYRKFRAMGAFEENRRKG